jgi:hypothetical protein
MYPRKHFKMEFPRSGLSQNNYLNIMNTNNQSMFRQNKSINMGLNNSMLGRISYAKTGCGCGK